MIMKIRALEMNDFPNWLPLWVENNLGQKNEAVTTQTWQRLTDPQSAVYGLCAVQGDEMLGFVHYITHPTTGALNDACYMQDVFTAPAHRQKGIANKLVQAVIARAKAQNYSRLYWLAQRENIAAQKLYEKIGQPIDFTVHVLPL